MFRFVDTIGNYVEVANYNVPADNMIRTCWNTRLILIYMKENFNHQQDIMMIYEATITCYLFVVKYLF